MLAINKPSPKSELIFIPADPDPPTTGSVVPEVAPSEKKSLVPATANSAPGATPAKPNLGYAPTVSMLGSAPSKLAPRAAPVVSA